MGRLVSRQPSITFPLTCQSLPSPPLHSFLLGPFLDLIEKNGSPAHHHLGRDPWARERAGCETGRGKSTSEGSSLPRSASMLLSPPPAPRGAVLPHLRIPDVSPFPGKLQAPCKGVVGFLAPSFQGHWKGQEDFSLCSTNKGLGCKKLGLANRQIQMIIKERGGIISTEAGTY